jgi:predicted small secreted protein
MPAFSCASRAALSVASWAAVSLDTKGAFAAGVGVGVVAAAAGIVVTPYITAPMTPPTSMDPVMAAAATVLRIPFMSVVSSWIYSLERWFGD